MKQHKQKKKRFNPNIKWFIPLTLVGFGVWILLGLLENEFAFMP